MFADSQNKKLIIFFAGLAGAAVILILGVNFLLKLLPLEEKSPPQVLEPIEIKTQNDQPAIKGAPSYKIIEPGQIVDTRPIIYTDSGFSPIQTVIQSNDPIGCLITVLNKSPRPIRVGVNPHNPEGDPGVNYGEILAEKSALLDVRYPGLTEIFLHSHPNTSHEFKVIYGQGCQ